MKSYLNFTLKGSQFFPVWIAFFFFFLIPMHLLLGEFNELIASDVPAEGPSKIFFLYLAFVLVMAFIFILFITKLVIQSIEFNGIKVICNYNTGKYIGIVISGLLLSIVTIGIYIPWFVRDINRFLIHGTSYDSHKFYFKGRGGRLFLIMTLTIFIAFLLVGIVLFSIFKPSIDIQSPDFIQIYQVVVISIFVAIIYLTFQWTVNIRYKNYHIKLETEFFPAIGKIAIELVLAVILVLIFEWLTSFIVILLWNPDSFPAAGKITIELILAVTTLSIYFAMAFIRLYRYFAEHTKSNIVDGKQITMGYVGDQFSDFKFMWEQILLTVITVGFYYPWAFSRIASRVLNQTYLSIDHVGVQEM